MSELRPYQVPSTGPLSAGARFIRGFKRVGIVLGILTLVAALGTGIFTGLDQQRNAERRYQQATCLLDKVRFGKPLKMETYDGSKVDTVLSGCPGPTYSDTIASITAFAQRAPVPAEYVIEPVFYAALIGAALATGIYLIFWVLGWLCAGFTRD
jgi:hypothetical protein